jgi:ATP-binding cassette subfamily B protein
MNTQTSTLSVRHIFRWFWHFTRPDKGFFFTAVSLSALATLVQDIIPPLIISKAFTKIQQLYLARQPLTFAAVHNYVIYYIAFIVLGLILWRSQTIFAWIFEVRSVQRIMDHAFNHIQQQSSRFHADHFGGALVSQVNKFSSGYEKVMDELLWSITGGVLALISSIVILISVSLPYGLALGVLSISYLLIMGRRTARQMPLDRALADSESKRTAKLADSITNVATIRSFAAETHESKLFHAQTSDTTTHYKRLLTAVLVNQSISHVGTGFINILAFAGGLAAISVFHAPLGVLFLAINYTMSISRRLWESNRVVVNINRAIGDAGTLAEILDEQPEIKDNPKAAAFTASSGAVNFKDVVFRYTKRAEKPIFDKLNLNVEAGEKIGLVGVSGGGKTTITKLLQREVDIEAGSISIDGHNIASLRLADVRQAISLVPQEPMLFHRSIADNIGYSHPGVNLDAIVAAAKMAHADDFITSLPDGYNTLVGERGVKLSGGQRQRIAIARAMLKNAPILVLDEATSALDSESELLIQDALWRLMETKTAIVIAHRLSTIQKMDRVVVLANGVIVEQGSHKDLLAHGGTYAKLWAHQSGGFIDE